LSKKKKLPNLATTKFCNRIDILDSDQNRPVPDESKDGQDWYKFLTEGEVVPRHFLHFMALLPSSPRCKLCNSPFKGWGGFLMHLLGRDQSRYNPRYCQKCDRFERSGGAVIELSMLFADVRGSTTLAEQMGAHEFSKLMNRFYKVATHVLVREDAMVDRLLGDEAIGLFIPAYTGSEHPRRAIEAAQNLLQETGHRDKNGPWLPVGVGVHTGPAFVGVVGGDQGGPKDFTALGDNVIVTSRLASSAGAGEILVSEAAHFASGLDLGSFERRQLELKGISEPTDVRVIHISAE
jgi:adenylate cyclase